MVTETFTNKHEIKNPSPHYNCLHLRTHLVLEEHLDTLFKLFEY